MNNPSALQRPARLTALALVCLPLVIALLGAGLRVVAGRGDRAAAAPGAPTAGAVCPCGGASVAARPAMSPAETTTALEGPLQMACLDLSVLADAPAH